MTKSKRFSGVEQMEQISSKWWWYGWSGFHCEGLLVFNRPSDWTIHVVCVFVSEGVEWVHTYILIDSALHWITESPGRGGERGGEGRMQCSAVQWEYVGGGVLASPAKSFVSYYLCPFCLVQVWWPCAAIFREKWSCHTVLTGKQQKTTKECLQL